MNNIYTYQHMAEIENLLAVDILKTYLSCSVTYPSPAKDVTSFLASHMRAKMTRQKSSSCLCL